MTQAHESVLLRLLQSERDIRPPPWLTGAVHIHPALKAEIGNTASRAVMAMALNLYLLADLLGRVPTGRQYMRELAAAGRQMTFDHGALRTVDLMGMGTLPAGERAITRILEPLGYRQTGLYPLDALKMTGRSYTHVDFPENVPQFFVSELHPARFSTSFQAAVARLTENSLDPLDAADMRLLDRLSADAKLLVSDAARLLPKLTACFMRQHPHPSLADYECVRAESAEMAWIATEGNAFNHATDRVASLEALVSEQRSLNRPLKDKIEVSRSGSVRQTAFRADPVERIFIDAQGREIPRQVPGSFFEFIQRDRICDAASGQDRLDLGFDSGNAQGIFKMTTAA
ncbi:2-oxoadipate dioxygenase/decarboxylase family protein [Rhizorhapis sp. SPR117]|uniref:2-oxoadipate dioxygenase/decarboxylase family protein n=1 Tax=Rhizorhapis sp. SPR117 TaxID=2912611 RepID=UPI001F3D0712|nr:DUF1338 family protein [Rhizorhapis sp. SPR117]